MTPVPKLPKGWKRRFQLCMWYAVEDNEDDGVYYREAFYIADPLPELFPQSPDLAEEREEALARIIAELRIAERTMILYVERYPEKVEASLRLLDTWWRREGKLLAGMLRDDFGMCEPRPRPIDTSGF